MQSPGSFFCTDTWMDDRYPCSFNLPAGENRANLNHIARKNESFSRTTQGMNACSTGSAYESDLLLDIFEHI
jgi:hypothetical protein